MTRVIVTSGFKQLVHTLNLSALHADIPIVQILASAKLQIEYRLRYVYTRTRAAHTKLPVDPCATLCL
jgi:hypothetical protein